MHFSSEYTFLGAIALVGGMISSYYYLIIFGMSGYTKFKYENELASKLFTTVMKPDDPAINLENIDDEEAKEQKTRSAALAEDLNGMTEAISNRRELPNYLYVNYLYDWFIVKIFCCCCRRKDCFRKSSFTR